jgi:hypothetical protein
MDDELKNDLVGPGIKAIADAANQSLRRTRTLIERHRLPCFLLGDRLYSRRSWLDRYFRGEPVPDAPSRPPKIAP